MVTNQHLFYWSLTHHIGAQVISGIGFWGGTIGPAKAGARPDHSGGLWSWAPAGSGNRLLWGARRLAVHLLTISALNKLETSVLGKSQDEVY